MLTTGHWFVDGNRSLCPSWTIHLRLSENRMHWDDQSQLPSCMFSQNSEATWFSVNYWRMAVSVRTS